MTASTNLLIESQYLPPIPTIALMLGIGAVELEKQEHYQKRSYRNRCKIATANGINTLSIPLKKGKNERMNIAEVQISNEENWQKQHWKTISSAYGNAPFFEHYEADFRPLFEQKANLLFSFNLSLLKTIIDILELGIQVDFSTVYRRIPLENSLDFRNIIKPQLKDNDEIPQYKSIQYHQVFEEKAGFIPGLSILDLVFCCGPQTILILQQSFINQPAK